MIKMAQVRSRPRDRHAFKIAIICALTLEAEMVESVFDQFWDGDGNKFGKAAGEQNAYTNGRLAAQRCLGILAWYGR